MRHCNGCVTQRICTCIDLINVCDDRIDEFNDLQNFFHLSSALQMPPEDLQADLTPVSVGKEESEIKLESVLINNL